MHTVTKLFGIFSYLKTLLIRSDESLDISFIENCLYGMLECAHHLLSHSTLSYTVLYMDKKYPENSLVISAPFSYLPVQMVQSNEVSTKEAQSTGLIYYSQLD